MTLWLSLQALGITPFQVFLAFPAILGAALHAALPPPAPSVEAAVLQAGAAL